MKERPILFNAPMVRAVLAGTKTQTRRVVKLPHMNPLGQWEPIEIGGPNGGRTKAGHTIPAHHAVWHTRTADSLMCPYGQPGDHLWIRETFAAIYPQDPTYNGGRPIEYDYRASYSHGDRLGDLIGVKKRWTPSIHMPRDASRITLEVTGVRVERLQDISEADAVAEGIEKTPHGFWSLYGQAEVDGTYSPYSSYRALWESINGAGSWHSNPYVWVVEFRQISPAAQGSAR